MYLDGKIEAGAENVLTKQAVFFSFLESDFQIFHRQRVFLAHVYIALISTDGVGTDHQSLENGEGVAFHHRAIHVGSRIPLVAVDNNILLLTWRLTGKIPLYP